MVPAVNPLAEYAEPVGAFVFHCTLPEDTDSILASGIKTTSESNPDTTAIDTALTDLGYDSLFPFDRTNATYCHVDAEDATHFFSSELSNDVAIVVDTARITAPMYLADMSIISDLLVYHFSGRTDVLLYGDTSEQVVKRYRDSITRVEKPADIAASVDTDIGHAELVVDGDIPPEAVVEIVK